MKFENTEVWGFEHSLRGMRNPKNSWNRSDSHYGCDDEKYCDKCHDVGEYCFGYKNNDNYIIGANDMKLAQTLIKAGNEHRKFMRQIFVSVDITAPLYWWKEFDTYKVGTVANSTSTMHKLATTPITLDCFEIGDYDSNLAIYEDDDYGFGKIGAKANEIMTICEELRQKYIQTGDKRYWKELIRWLPSSWLQTRTWTSNYETIRNMYHQRKNHKLTEWKDDFCSWVETLPYAAEFLTDENIIRFD